MSQRYRTAFAVASGFSAATASAPKVAVAADRKPVHPGRPAPKPSREAKIEARTPNQAA